jgi:hypothetical protein
MIAISNLKLQMLLVVIAFSEHHVEKLVGKLKLIPHVGTYLQAPLKEFLNAQKLRLHRKPTDSTTEQVCSGKFILSKSKLIIVINQAASKLEIAMQLLVVAMVVVFIVSLIHSLAQRYHKRLCDSRTPRKSSKKTQ